MTTERISTDRAGACAPTPEQPNASQSGRTRELPPIGTPERDARDLLDTGCLGCPTCRVRGKRVARALLDQYAQSARKSEGALCEVCGAHPAVLEARWLNRGTTMRYCAADECRADVDLTMRTDGPESADRQEKP